MTAAAICTGCSSTNTDLEIANVYRSDQDLKRQLFNQPELLDYLDDVFRQNDRPYRIIVFFNGNDTFRESDNTSFYNTHPYIESLVPESEEPLGKAFHEIDSSKSIAEFYFRYNQDDQAIRYLQAFFERSKIKPSETFLIVGGGSHGAHEADKFAQKAIEKLKITPGLIIVGDAISQPLAFPRKSFRLHQIADVPAVNLFQRDSFLKGAEIDNFFNIRIEDYLASENPTSFHQSMVDVTWDLLEETAYYRTRKEGSLPRRINFGHYTHAAAQIGTETEARKLLQENSRDEVLLGLHWFENNDLLDQEILDFAFNHPNPVIQDVSIDLIRDNASGRLKRYFAEKFYQAARRGQKDITQYPLLFNRVDYNLDLLAGYQSLDSEESIDLSRFSRDELPWPTRKEVDRIIEIVAALDFPLPDSMDIASKIYTFNLTSLNLYPNELLGAINKQLQINPNSFRGNEHQMLRIIRDSLGSEANREKQGTETDQIEARRAQVDRELTEFLTRILQDPRWPREIERHESRLPVREAFDRALNGGDKNPVEISTNGPEISM